MNEVWLYLTSFSVRDWSSPSKSSRCLATNHHIQTSINLSAHFFVNPYSERIYSSFFFSIPRVIFAEVFPTSPRALFHLKTFAKLFLYSCNSAERFLIRGWLGFSESNSFLKSPSPNIDFIVKNLKCELIQRCNTHQETKVNPLKIFSFPCKLEGKVYTLTTSFIL